MTRNRSGNQNGWGLWNLILALTLLSALASPVFPHVTGFSHAAAQGQAAQGMQAEIYLDMALETLITDNPYPYEVVNDFDYTCIPGRRISPFSGQIENTANVLAVSDTGAISGKCDTTNEKNGEKSTLTASLNGQVTLGSGKVTFSGTSNFVWDIPESNQAYGHYTKDLTFSATATYTPDPQNPSRPQHAKGTFNFSFRQTGGPQIIYDTTYTGSFPFEMEFYGDLPNVPRVTIDRAEAARFSALKLAGNGFEKGDALKILFNGVEIFQVDVLPNGTIPDDTWIWVPDDATLGVNKVWAEVKGKNTKTAEVELNVKAISRTQLVANFDELVKQYLATIPQNDRWYGKLRSGSIRNIVNAGQSVGAAILWLPTAILTLGQYQDELWPDNKYVCSWYQAETLQFLNVLRFDPDPARRAILDGLDYGPFNSGPADIPPVSHFYAVVWPHAAALDPALSSSGFPASWDTGGIAFDPWPKQKPEIFALKPGTADWADESTYSSRWKVGPQYSYLLARPEPKSFNYNQGNYPITGGNYYTPPGKQKLAADYRNIVGIGGEPPKMVATHSPVTLEFTDEQGDKAGMTPAGDLYSDIPDLALLVAPKADGGYEWYAVLPAGKIDITVTGIDSGTYQLETKTAGQPILEYPPISVTIGATASLTLDDQPEPKPLQTSDGQTLLPVEKPLPFASQPAPDSTSQAKTDSTNGNAPAAPGNSASVWWVFVLLGCLCLGIVAVAAGVGGFLFLRSRRKPGPMPSPAPRMNPPVAPPGAEPGRPALAPQGAAPQGATPSQARLVVLQGPVNRPQIELVSQSVVIGRGPSNLLVINDSNVSRHHARIDLVNAIWIIFDLSSVNGTFVNGVRITRQALRAGDRIQIGAAVLEFQLVP